MDKSLPLSEVFANPNQPRKQFDEKKLLELAESIAEYGLLEPIVVTPRGDKFMIIAGERRFRASSLAGMETIPARIIEADDALVEEMALLENIQRADLTPLEEARAYQSLLDRGWSIDTLAAKMGKARRMIMERLALLKLEAEILQAYQTGVIGIAEAVEIARLPGSMQGTLLAKITSGAIGRGGKRPLFRKLRACVDAMLGTQEAVFALQEIAPEENQFFDKFDTLLRHIDELLTAADSKSITKAGYHQTISAERLDMVIERLMKLRRTLTKGSALKTSEAA